MRIGIDYWPATTHAPGVGRYLRELVRALVRRAEATWLGLYDLGPRPRVMPPEALGLPRSGEPAAGRVRRVGLRVPRRLVAALGVGADRWLGGVDLFHRAFALDPRVSRARETMALAAFPPPGSPEHQALGRLDGVFVFCSAARAAAAERLGLDAERIHVVPPGAEHWRRGADAPLDARPSAIAVLGRVDRARRPLAILAAAGELRSGGAELELVFAGRPGDAAAELEAALAASRAPARWLREPGEEELAALVARSAALVHLEPECWTAVTPLEACATGAAVVAPRLSPFDEALGGEAVWVPYEVEPRELAAALERALASGRDPAARARRRARAAEFTWDRAAGLTLAAWRQILGRA
jgi:glycosyltransferase involved in cell wall biosynthesis